MTSVKWAAYSGAAGFATVGLASLLFVGPQAVLLRDAAFLPGRAPAVVAVPPEAARQALPGPLPRHATPAAKVAAAPAGDGYYERLRKQLNWVQTRIGDATLLTPDVHSRVLLAKSAARRARLEEVGLSYMDVYGIINAETSWVPRLGASKDGTPNIGIAQFEPATARALGLRNPNDPVEAIHGAAVLMKEAALWSANRVDGLKLGAGERAEKLREGISIYYNLSSKARAKWDGRNTRKLPRETQLHILNAKIGAREAALHEAQMRAATFRRGNDEAVLTAGDLPSGG